MPTTSTVDETRGNAIFVPPTYAMTRSDHDPAPRSNILEAAASVMCCMNAGLLVNAAATQDSKLCRRKRPSIGVRSVA